MMIIVFNILFIVVLLVIEDLVYMKKQSERISRLEDDQRYINNERKGWKW